MLQHESPRMLDKRFSDLYEIIVSKRFLHMEGLGNEVPFFISPYAPQNQNAVYVHISLLIKKLQTHGVEVLHIDLYDLCINLLKQEGDLELILEKEASWTKTELHNQLKALLDPEHELIPEIHRLAKAASFKVVIITGAGAAFPFLRSHAILNNLQKVFANAPLIMFYPGEYSHDLQLGSSLALFGKLKGNKYYRAFNLNNYQR